MNRPLLVILIAVAILFSCIACTLGGFVNGENISIVTWLLLISLAAGGAYLIGRGK